MKWIYLSALPGNNADVVRELIPVYTRLKMAAGLENNLRAYLRAELMLISLKYCIDAIVNPQWHMYPPRFYYIEDTDSVEEILAERFKYVYNGVLG